MGNIRWGPDTTVLDIVRKTKVLMSQELVGQYRELLLSTFGMAFDGTCDQKATEAEGLIDYVYEQYGRPKWFIDKEVFELLTTLHVETDDLTGIFFPHDVFTFVFEHGTTLAGYPLRNVRVFYPRARLTLRFMEALQPLKIDRSPDRMSLLIDAGDDGLTNATSWDTKWGLRKWSWTRPLDDRDGGSLKRHSTLSVKEREYVGEVARLVVSALLYHSAKPDHVIPFQLPRSCRYEYKGDRNNYRRMLVPQAVAGRKWDGIPTGRTVAGHYRGWVLRTLRDERYKRNADGTFKTVLVEPVAVKGGPVAAE